MIDNKVLLVGERLRHRAFNGSNQALPWLASALHNKGYSSIQFDMENPNNTLERLLQESEEANLIMFCGTFSTQLDLVDEHSRQIKKHLNQKGRNPVIIVGGYGAASVERYSEHAPSIDAFFFGPGIDSVVTITESVKSGRFKEDLQNLTIPGLSYFDPRKKRFMRGKSVPLPSPESLGKINQLFNRDYIPKVHDMKDIFSDSQGNPLPTFQIVTELGCPYNCSFCSESGSEGDQMFLGRGVSEVSLKRIEEVFKQANQQGYRAVYFDVETAFRNWKRMEKILQMANDYGFVNGLNTRIDTVTEERIQRARKLGNVYAFYGVEHLDPQVLFAIDKFPHKNPLIRKKLAKEYPQRVSEAFSMMNNQQIQSSLFLIMGLPKIKDSYWNTEKETNPNDSEYECSTYEADKEAILKSFEIARPYHFNANILRLNPDTSMAWQSRFSCIRPSGEEPIDAVWFVPRVAGELGLKLQEFHPIYRFFEGVENNQPYSTAIDPQRAYDTAKVILDSASRYRTHVYFDPQFKKDGLVTRNETTGEYKIAPLKSFE